MSISQTLRLQLRDWPAWWRELSPVEKWLPVVFWVIYWPFLHALGGLRVDHVLIGGLAIGIACGGRYSRALFRVLLPMLITVTIYDSMRFYADYIRGPIHVTQPYDFDKYFFGIETAQGRLTPNEWCQLHLHPALDLLTGFAYLVFFMQFIALGLYFNLYLSRHGTASRTAAEVSRIAPRMMWGFLILNLLGYSTYYWYAAAPPWYVSLYGLGPARMDVAANPAGCLRFDQMLGTHFFTGFYGRAADVFGAIPSLHIAYPLLATLYAFRLGTVRAFALGFFLLMCFSAVYLNHHYVLDILWGSAYTLLVFALMESKGGRRVPELI